MAELFINLFFLLDHFKSCQSKKRKAPQRQESILSMLNKRKRSEQVTSREESASVAQQSIAGDSDVDISDTEDTTA